MGILSRDFIFSNPKLIGRVLKIYNCSLRNRIHMKKSNKLEYRVAKFDGFRIHVNRNGTGNTVIIGDFSRLINCDIFINGSNNTVIIGDRCYLNSVGICIEDDKNSIIIGNHTSFAGSTELAAIEGTKITIGEDCMFSANIKIRTGDSHSITNKEGIRINDSKSVFIGNHVWVGNSAVILKGCTLKNNSIVAHSAVVSNSFEEEGIIVAGVPAKCVKSNINWSRNRI